ncbi:HIT family protein [Arthrobacter sp. JSM 101049]|uniref:HIT family protein n=1 Tax=Arthrobacter sp. JSM 101049 TaxID=929097 RepID=UPI0035693296
MSTLFTKIINGELPGRFIWKDPDVVAFLSIGPITDGHTLVVPRQEVDQWTDADPELLSKLTGVARIIGRAQTRAFGSERAGLMVAGFEVPHLHVHVWPTNSLADFDLSRADTDPKAARLDENAEKLRTALREDGHTDTVPAS